MSAEHLPAPLRPIPEWAPHRAIWLAWPWDASEWGEPLAGAQRCLRLFIDALCAAKEAVELLVHNEATLQRLQDDGVVRAVWPSPAPQPGQVRAHLTPYGDIWTRDTGPLFGLGPDGQRAALRPVWNGWGGKYLMDGDADVGPLIAARAGVPLSERPYVLEGGGLDFDGAGALLTTRECLLNPNRNPGWTEATATAALRADFALDRVIWLGDGLLNDHTDGHVDNIARFVAPGRAVAMRPAPPDDPHAARLQQIQADLEAALGPDGVVTIPSPGRVLHPETGAVLPASYLNFLIAAEAVIVPVYGTPTEDAALAALEPLFPGRRVVPIETMALLTGGGSLHCISKDEPAP